MDSGEYWRKRREEIEKREAVSTEEALRRLQTSCRQAREGIQADLERYYARYAAGQGVSYAEAKRALSQTELRRFRMSLEEFRDKAIRGGYEKELDAIYLRRRVSRLQALQARLALRTSGLAARREGILRGHLRDVFTDTYYRDIYAAERQLGRGLEFARFSGEDAEKIVSRPWAGDSFSGRIWKDKEKLSNELSRSLSLSAIRGDGIDRAAKELAARLDVSEANTRRLARTETAHIAAEADFRGYRETGVGDYEFLAALSEKTCPVCGVLDGKVFAAADRQTGVNCPPIHPNCRCTTVPHFDDEFTAGEMRAARDENGKTIYVPADVTFEQWKAERLDKSGRSGILKGRGLKAARRAGEGEKGEKHTAELAGAVDFSDKKAVYSKMEDFEREHAASETESCLIATASGELYIVRGDAASVDTSLLGDKLRGSVNTHNHPAAVTQYSFSLEDLESFLQDGSAVMRGVDEKYVYEMVHPGNLPSPEKIAETVARVEDELYSKMDEYEVRFEDYEEQRQHILISEICKRVGILYKRWLK